MEVKVCFLGSIKLVTKERERLFSLNEGDKVADLISIMNNYYGSDFKNVILREDGDLNGDIAFFVNDENIRTGGLQTKLILTKENEGIEVLVYIFSSFEGG